MPIFEYECNKCGHRFEQLVRPDSKPECPSCRSRSLEKQWSAFAVGAAAPEPPTCESPCGRCGDPAGPCAAN